MLRLHFKTKGPVLIDSGSFELTFTICFVMVYREKHLTKIKKLVEWDSNHLPDALWINGRLQLHPLHAPFNEWWIVLACKNKFCDPQRHSFHFQQVLFWLMQRLLSYQHAKNTDGQTNRQRDNFKLYIPYSGLFSLDVNFPELPK